MAVPDLIEASTPSLNHACWDHVPTFPQRSPPSLLTTAACGGLRSAPDCRTRRALLHLPYSCAPPCGEAMLVTQDPTRTSLRLFLSVASTRPACVLEQSAARSQ